MLLANAGSDGSLDGYREGSADFAGCLIGPLNREAGCEETVPFDRDAAEVETCRELTS